MTRAWLLGVLVVTGCGADALEQTPLAEVCGQHGPVRVLELQLGEVMIGSPLVVGDRTVYAVVRHAPPAGDTSLAKVEGGARWSTGPCGESPVQLTTTPYSVFVRERWPNVLLGQYREGGDIVTIDPRNEVAPHVVFTDVGDGPLRWTDRGLVTTQSQEDGVTLEVSLHPYPVDPRTETAAPILPLGSIPDATYRADLVIHDDEMLAVEADDELVRTSLIDGTKTLVQSDVRDFEASPDGRWILWQDTSEISNENPERPAGQIYLRDTTTGQDTFLIAALLAATPTPFQHIEHGLLVVNEGSYRNTPQRVYDLETFDHVELPGHLTLESPLADGRWLISNFFDFSPHKLFDPRTRTTTSLYDRVGTVMHRSEDGLEILDVKPCCVEEATFFDQGALYFVPFAGPPRLLAEQATQLGRRLGDGRRITPIDVNDDALATLVLVDPDTRTTTSIDDHVFAVLTSLAPGGADDRTLYYSVDDGARTGVWLARLPAAGG